MHIIHIIQLNKVKIFTLMNYSPANHVDPIWSIYFTITIQYYYTIQEFFVTKKIENSILFNYLKFNSYPPQQFSFCFYELKF